MRTRTIFAVFSLFLMTLLAMPPSVAGTTQQDMEQTVQTMGVMEAGAYEMNTPIMECPWMGYEIEQAEGEIIFAECLQNSPTSPEASLTDFVRLWYPISLRMSTSPMEITQHSWHY